MQEVILTRLWRDDKQTLGVLVVPKNDLWVCKTLELSWKNNQPNISCISAGTYLCTYTRSNRLSQIAGADVYTYELVNVKGRTGIRIHSANYYFQLEGCIALGSALKDLNADARLDLIHSGETVKQFEALMQGKNFWLIIQERIYTNLSQQQTPEVQS
jgi:hypothetical protein